MSSKQNKKVKAFITLYKGKPYNPLFGDYHIKKKSDGKEFNKGFSEAACTIIYSLTITNKKRKVWKKAKEKNTWINLRSRGTVFMVSKMEKVVRSASFQVTVLILTVNV